jgi:hypothetical protein
LLLATARRLSTLSETEDEDEDEDEEADVDADADADTAGEAEEGEKGGVRQSSCGGRPLGAASAHETRAFEEKSAERIKGMKCTF